MKTVYSFLLSLISLASWSQSPEKIVRGYNYETRGELRIDLSDQPDGLYVIRAVYKDRQFDQRKLILKK